MHDPPMGVRATESSLTRRRARVSVRVRPTRSPPRTNAARMQTPLDSRSFRSPCSLARSHTRTTASHFMLRIPSHHARALGSVVHPTLTSFERSRRSRPSTSRACSHSACDTITRGAEGRRRRSRRSRANAESVGRSPASGVAWKWAGPSNSTTTYGDGEDADTSAKVPSPRKIDEADTPVDGVDDAVDDAVVDAVDAARDAGAGAEDKARDRSPTASKDSPSRAITSSRTSHGSPNVPTLRVASVGVAPPPMLALLALLALRLAVSALLLHRSSSATRASSFAPDR